MRQYASWRQLEEMVAGLVGANHGPAQRIAMEYSPDNAIPYVSYVDAGTKELVERVTHAEIVSSADLVQLVQAVLSDAANRQPSPRRGPLPGGQRCRLRSDPRSAAEPDTGERNRCATCIMDHFAAAKLECDHPPIVAVNAHAADPHYAPAADQHRP